MSETAKFTEDILTIAREKSQGIISKAQDDARRVLDEAKANFSREASEIIRSAEGEAEAIKRRQVSEARHELKLREQEEKNKILSDVLNQTRTRASEISSDETRYGQYLAKLVVSGINELGLDNVTLHLNATDMKRFSGERLHKEISKQLQKPTKIEFAREPIDTVAGVIISNNDGTIRIVNTFEQRYEALEARLLIEAGKLLFAN
ncbi:MAG TPA: V-type ATP synthase subunit E family protein [Candidatus Saccharimonadales bacterium]|nr:V-type ATP synthase subunit E family protein [Candidatus Saccharimonadales bacterium]